MSPERKEYREKILALMAQTLNLQPKEIATQEDQWIRRVGEDDRFDHLHVGTFLAQNVSPVYQAILLSIALTPQGELPVFYWPYETPAIRIRPENFRPPLARFYSGLLELNKQFAPVACSR